MRTEDAVADHVSHADKSSFASADHYPMRPTIFIDDSTEPPSPEKRTGDALVDKSAKASESCLSTVDMPTPTATVGLLATGIASTAMIAVFPRPRFSLSLGDKTMKNTSPTNFNQLLYWNKVIRTKQRQTMVLDLGGCSGRLRGCPFLRGLHAMLSGWVRLNL